MTNADKNILDADRDWLAEHMVMLIMVINEALM